MTEKQPLQQAILGLLLAWALIAQLTYSGFLIYLQANASRFAQVPFHTYSFSTTISEIPEAYLNSGLQAWDNVLALNGEPVKGEEQLDEVRFGSRPGETLTVTVERSVNGQSKKLTVPVTLHRASTKWLIVLVLTVFLPLSCLLVGFYIAFARPRDVVAWITMAMLASFGQVVGSGVSWFIGSPWKELLFIYHAVLSNSWPLWLLLFALYFPVPFAWWKKYSWLNWVLAVPSVILGSFDIYGYSASRQAPPGVG